MTFPEMSGVFFIVQYVYIVTKRYTSEKTDILNCVDNFYELRDRGSFPEMSGVSGYCTVCVHSYQEIHKWKMGQFQFYWHFLQVEW